MELPTWKECDERKEQLNNPDRTIAQSVMSGSKLNPLEEFIHSQEPAHPGDREFRLKLALAIDWAIANT